MSATETAARPAPAVGDEPPTRHLARMSERRFDGTVETLCGLTRTFKPPRPDAVPCEKCAEVRRLIREMESL